MPRIEVPEDVLAVVNRLRDAGHETYLCGGCVRDALLGGTPKDWDVTTDATPEAVERCFARTVPVGRAFGVMVVVLDDRQVEVATFRADKDYSDGRRPDAVVFGSAEEDVKRRDFTVNALLYDPARDAVLDYVGGEKDLARKVLRTVGVPRERFLEDHLRLLRAVRFAARLDFRIDAATAAALGEMAGLVRTVSGERAGMEIRRMLLEGDPRRALELLESTHLLLHALPEVAAERGVPQPEAFHPEGDVFTHTALMLDHLDEAEPDVAPTDETAREILAFAVLLHDIGKPPTISVRGRIRFDEHDAVGASMAEGVLERLRRPRRVIETVRDIIGRHMHFADLPNMRKAKRRRFLREPEFPLHLELHRLDCISSHRQLDRYRFGLEAWREERAVPPPRDPLLRGDDLLALGYREGPRLGEILNAVEDARLEGEIESAEEARRYVREAYPPDAEATDADAPPEQR